mmetsp:Transcript_4959/g.22208  ORF Transcript_4959/g.22208 Transcript_4959/m.22208 type:complete len:204 (+) Transcript_4959:787-1398(+)
MGSDVAGLGVHHLPHRVGEFLHRLEHHALALEGGAVRTRVHSVNKPDCPSEAVGSREGLPPGEPVALCVHTGVHHAHGCVIHRLLLRYPEVQRVRAISRVCALPRGSSVAHGSFPGCWSAVHGQRSSHDAADTPVRQTIVLGTGVRGGETDPDPDLHRGILYRGVEFGREGGSRLACRRRLHVSKLHSGVKVVVASKWSILCR